jgi:hypothetical protein
LTAVSDGVPSSTEAEWEMDDDDILMQQIDEPTLRRLCRGLCGG